MSDIDERIVVRLKALEHHFGERRVFQNINAAFYSGQTGVITGRNGAGKSTLLKIIAGLLPPEHGEAQVILNGFPLNNQARRKHLGYVSPDLALYAELTAAENLQFFAQIRGVALSRQEMIDRLSQVGLKGRGRDLVRSYSSGMRQRLKYAIALLHAPPILLLDEPSANLDVHGIAIVEEILARHRRRADGGIILIATNEPRELAWGETRIDLEATP